MLEIVFTFEEVSVHEAHRISKALEAVKEKIAKEKVVKCQEKKIQTRIRLPSKMKKDISVASLRKHESLRMKSYWVEVAIASFIESPSWECQVLDGEMVRENNDVDIFYLSLETSNVIR